MLAEIYLYLIDSYSRASIPGVHPPQFECGDEYLIIPPYLRV